MLDYSYISRICNIEWEMQISMAHSDQTAAQTNAEKKGKEQCKK